MSASGYYYDAVVVGSGPNGLTAAVLLARRGWRVLVLEASERAGGGTRTAELTLPGFRHDVCSAVHPLGVGSPAFAELGLERYGLHWIHPPIPAAHPLEGRRAVTLERDLDATAGGLAAAGAAGDGRAYRALMGPLVRAWPELTREVLAPPLHWPRRPLPLARFGLRALPSAAFLARRRFAGQEARALWAGLAAHSLLPLEAPLSSAFAAVLGAAGHAVGWPLPRGGAQAIANALVAALRAHGGEVATSERVDDVDALPASRAVLLDLTPKEVLRVAGARFPEGYRRVLQRYRYGPGVFKLDYALSAPIPWRAEACARAGTVHLGGTLDEVAASESSVAEGREPNAPFVLVTQPSLFDPDRAPPGKHVAWAYCHVPNGSTVDMAPRIDAQIERFAPGFRDAVLARASMTAPALEAYNANYVGGDMSGGTLDLRQLVARPALRLDPYATPDPRLFLCSSATPPGGGVHGMAGFHAARSVLRRHGGR